MSALKPKTIAFEDDLFEQLKDREFFDSFRDQQRKSVRKDLKAEYRKGRFDALKDLSTTARIMEKDGWDFGRLDEAIAILKRRYSGMTS